MTHTPGPWNGEKYAYTQGALDNWIVFANPNKSDQIAIVNKQADARLIAAAPELLKALQAIERRGIGPDGHVLANWPGYETATVAYELATIARAAINKATSDA